MAYLNAPNPKNKKRYQTVARLSIVFVAAFFLCHPTPCVFGSEESSSNNQSTEVADADYPKSNEEKPIEKTPKPQLIDRLHDGLAQNIDGSARWVDGFFGERSVNKYTKGAHGRLSTRFYAQEYEGLTSKVRLRAVLPLTNIHKSMNAILGRGDIDEIIEGANDYDNYFSTTDENSWLAGLGYTPPWSKSERVKLSAGVKLKVPPIPYVRATYRYKHEFDEKSLVRLRQSFFWESEDGIGASTSIDAERRLEKNHLIRWSNWAKIHENSSGFIFDSRLLLYQKLSSKRALLYTLIAEGESDAPTPIKQYGGFLTYKQQLWREWFYGELILGATKLYKESWSTHRTSLIFGLGFEMVFSSEDKKVENASTLSNSLSRSF